MNFERGIEDTKKSLQIGEKYKAIKIIRIAIPMVTNLLDFGVGFPFSFLVFQVLKY